MSLNGVGLSSSEINDQIRVMHSRRAEMQRELEDTNQQLSKTITKIRNIEMTAKRGGYVKAESLSHWIAKERDLRHRKTELQSQLGAMRDVLAGLRAQLRATATVEARRSLSDSMNSIAIVQLNELRLYYERFAGDKSRVNSMRLMAGEFAAALAPIIRALHANE